ncbi:glycosyltransferase family 2 protein [Pedobacter sp. V48]|uniref:glycosyltransferase n=1 Tax=Pedobacter sp. V48 TaxID=509635 RepID=UPI0003E51022|nr:glycosyltransferase family A protein [Pedobacter sp. V48]ETZ22608.1 hypothetical protein N824_22300 [Pedobacter sp. V48]
MSLRPLSIPSYIKAHQYNAEWFLNHVDDIRRDLHRFNPEHPDVTVIIPAYNEEDSILRTLSSLSKTITVQQVQILVVNNNSTDNTQKLIELTGANFIIEYKQGVKHARNAGLAAAKGKVIINADADSVYSPYWVDLISLPLKDNNVACAYGRFAFLPDKDANRGAYFLYETVGDLFKRVIQRNKDEAMYVYGCSSGYRKDQGLSVGGYEHPPGANEDGYMALKLRSKFGILYRVTDNRSLVWTSDRRLMEQGGLLKAFMTRLSSMFK